MATGRQTNPPLLELVRALGPFVRPYRRACVLVCLCLGVETAFSAFLPLSFSFLIDRALEPRDRRVLVLVVALLAGGAIAATVAGVARDHIHSRLFAGVVADLRLKLFDHLQWLSLGFYTRTPAAQIVSRFSGDLAYLENALVTVLAWAIAPTLAICVYTILLFVLDWQLALGAMLVWPVALLGPHRVTPRAVRAENEKKVLERAALTVVQESVVGHAVVKAFSLEQARLARFEERNAALRRNTEQGAFLGALAQRLAVSGVLVLNVVVIAVGAWFVFDGLLSVGKLVAFQALFLALGYSLSSTAQYVPSLVQGLVGFGHIHDVLREAPQVVDAPAAPGLSRFGDEIVFDDVTFSYSDGEPGLRSFTARIRKGEFVALVGTSGSGKSTVLSLLMRLYDPQTGSVSVDGHDLRTVGQASLRSQLGLVFQESFLFDETIRENIRLGDPRSTDEQVTAAARAAEVHDAILAQPAGYDTDVGERGGRLSGGQRQRIAIARTLLRDPPIVLLDEATTALDPATEAAVNATLARLRNGKTIVSATHRLSSVKDADRILVLERGQLVESGRHEELLAADGAYAALWRHQSGFTLIDGGDRIEVAAERLAEIPVFAGIELGLLEEMAHRFASEHVPAGRIVAQEGDPGERFYIVVRGRLEVARRDEAGNEVRVNVLEDGDHFGEVALLRAGIRVATVRTETPCLLISLAREHFLEFLDAAPAVRASLETTVDGYLANWASRRLNP